MAFDTTIQFAEQVTTNSLVQNLVYASGTVGAIMIVFGLILIDVGGTRRRSSFNSSIEKLVGFFIGFTTYFLIGFSFWAAQFYIMEGYTLMDSINDLWAGGGIANALAQDVDPAVFPGVNTFQIFIFFLACFAGIVNVLLHIAVSERMKPAAYFITSFVATIVSSILSWVLWGSVGPLTNLGFHDFFGVAFVYLFPASMALFFVTQLRPRPGMFSPHPKVDQYRPPNLALITAGVVGVFASLPMVIMSCLFFIEGDGAEAYAISVTMADTSVGIALNNFAASWAGGMLMGAILAYSTRKYSYLLLGPLAGYLAGAPAFDVYLPWQTFLVSFFAPVVVYIIYEAMYKRGIDEHKIIPLFVGAVIYGLIMVGLVAAGTPRGGYIGIEEGIYAFQHGQVGVVIQLVGIAVVLAAGIVTAAVLTVIFKLTVGLEVDEEDQAEGLDKVMWGLEPDVQPNAEK